MAVFVAASDESAGKNQRDTFFFGGFVGPEDDWSRFFAPAWQERVLDGPPAIPYLHMTDIRSPQWRAKYGLSRLQADDRVDEAFHLIDTMPTLYPVGVHVDAGHLRDKFGASKVVASTGASRPFEPDYLCFLAYAFAVLSHVKQNHPEAERVDFVIERKQHVTRYIREFHSQLAMALEALREPSLSSIVGDLIPGARITFLYKQLMFSVGTPLAKKAQWTPQTNVVMQNWLIVVAGISKLRMPNSLKWTMPCHGLRPTDSVVSQKQLGSAWFES